MSSHCLVTPTGSARTTAYEWGIRSIRFQMTEKKDEKANFLLCRIASIISLHSMRQIQHMERMKSKFVVLQFGIWYIRRVCTEVCNFQKRTAA